MRIKLNRSLVLFIITLSLFISTGCGVNNHQKSFGKWTYIQVDSTRGTWSDFGEKPAFLRYFGLTFGDVNLDGYKDIISGRYWYLNPGGNLSGPWLRYEFPVNLDACLTVDVDNDQFVDIIGESLPNVYWLEQKDKSGTKWDTLVIGTIPPERHRNGQGHKSADLNNDGRIEVLLAAERGIYCFEVPANPSKDKWNITLIAETESSEGFDVYDIDKDGDLDIVAGNWDKGVKSEVEKGIIKPNRAEPTALEWYENPGAIQSNWKSYEIGSSINAIDRIRVSDVNNDGLPDIIVSEERFPGLEPDAHLFIYKGASEDSIFWKREMIYRGFSLNNLDLGDLNNDGHIDIVTAEHKGNELKTMVFINDGSGKFRYTLVDTGKESHLGTQLIDLDKDNDLDIISITWDQPKYLHLWRNDNKKSNL
jgi:hypothetical protein